MSSKATKNQAKDASASALSAANSAQGSDKPLKRFRIRVNDLMTAGGIAHEHARILKMLLRGLIDPTLASRLSGMFVNQRVLLEYENAERRIEQLEQQLELVSQGKLLTLKTS
jgi:citrate lyase beta subunit